MFINLKDNNLKLIHIYDKKKKHEKSHRDIVEYYTSIMECLWKRMVQVELEYRETGYRFMLHDCSSFHKNIRQFLVEKHVCVQYISHAIHLIYLHAIIFCVSKIKNSIKRYTFGETSKSLKLESWKPEF